MIESNQTAPVQPAPGPGPQSTPFPVMAAASILIGLGILGSIAALVVLIQVDRRNQIAPALGACAVCLIGSLITLMPLRRAAGQSVQRLPMAALGGTVIRLAVAFAGGAVLIGLVDLAFTPVALWTLGWYLLLLVAEVVILTRYFRHLGEAAGHCRQVRV